MDSSDYNKMRAVEVITADIVANIARKAANLIRDTLGDWKEEITISEEEILTEKELGHLNNRYEKIKNIIK